MIVFPTCYDDQESCTQTIKCDQCVEMPKAFGKDLDEIFFKSGTEYFMVLALSQSSNSAHVGRQRQYLQSLWNSKETMGCLPSYQAGSTKPLRDLDIL